MRNSISILFLFFGLCVQAQNNSKISERFPVFPECEGQENEALETCFYNTVHDFVYNNFNVPVELKSNDYKGTVIVLFEVTNEGKFIVQYVDANEKELVEESKTVFTKLPKISPATHNGNPTYAKYTIRINIPLQSVAQIQHEKEVAIEAEKKATKKTKTLTEVEGIQYQTFDQPQYESHNNIPFSHNYYAQFDDKLNQVGANNHTSSKPYSYAEVNKYYNFKDAFKAIEKPKTTWLGKKFWNENMVELKGEDYWFTLNPIVDLQAGKSKSNISSSSNTTYVNTRGIQFNGGLGKIVNFTTTLYESQGRFAGYFNRFAESLKPDGGNPAIIPGIGIAKDFKTDSYDFPLAEANLAFTPSNFFNLNLGYGRNFLGDGYRSLLLSDGASPYPYIKVNTTFWKIKYTNIYTWLKDVRPEVTVDRTFATKYVASHYLSLNVNKRLNLGFFESVVWTNQNNRGFDMSFANPIIFYRAVEFSSSSRSGNALLGLTAKYKFNNQINFYSQFLIDEFSFDDIKAGAKSWKNKFGYQLGAKYYNAFNVKNLLLQLEYNHVRPYVYSHSEPITNYGHNNQSLGHNWGGNFKEFVAIGHYFKGRYFADAKFTFGERGLDFNTDDNNFNYGGNIYLDYDIDRPYNTGVVVGQGNKTTVFIVDLQAGYLINPSTNMKLYGSLIYRNFNPNAETLTTFKENTSWLSIGLRCDIFNWYFDY